MSIYELLNRLASHSAAISTVVSIAEILKNNGFAIEKSETFSFLLSFFIKNICISMLLYISISFYVMVRNRDQDTDGRHERRSRSTAVSQGEGDY